MRVIFFDTECNGWQKGPMSTRVIQLAWQVADLNTGQLIKRENHLIRPDRWVIRNKFCTDLGFSTENNYRNGKPMPQVIDSFLRDYETCVLIVAHNLTFDLRVLGAEMELYKKKAAKKIHRLCTMKTTKELVKATNKKGQKKDPSLKELSQYLFNRDVQGAHDADADVTALRVIFFELLNRKIIDISTLCQAVV
jgi:DNA polymerase III epsilon subunit-like protein